MPEPSLIIADGRVDLLATHELWSKHYRDLSTEDRARFDAAALRYAEGVDPTGRLRWLIELGPERYEQEYREMCQPCRENRDHEGCAGVGGLMFRIPIDGGTFTCRCHGAGHPGIRAVDG